MSRERALVTGGASGIGLAIVERLLSDGVEVDVIDRDRDAIERASRHLAAQRATLTWHAVDLTDDEAVGDLVASLPPFDVLVNNAGVFNEAGFFELSREDYRRVYEINLVAMAGLTKEVAARMPRGGRIVNIASRVYLGARQHAHYVAAKAAVVGYTRAAALELVERGIAVNAVAPGLIDTPMLQALTPERKAAQLAVQLTGQAGTPADVAHAVAFLADRRTRFLTGQVVLVDGGHSLGGSLS